VHFTFGPWVLPSYKPYIFTIPHGFCAYNKKESHCTTALFSTSGGFMFPEYRDLITQLKSTDRHFLKLFDKHNELDQTILNMESHVEHGTSEEIEALKKQKLQLKDELYDILKKAQS
jgi:uncharacterized protein